MSKYDKSPEITNIHKFDILKLDFLDKLGEGKEIKSFILLP